MHCVGKDDDADGGGGKRDEVDHVFGGAIEDETTLDIQVDNECKIFQW